MWQAGQLESERRGLDRKAAKSAARTVFHPGLIESDIGSAGGFAKELRMLRRIPTSYFINPIFADFRILIDRMHSGLERTVVAALEHDVQSMDERIARLRQPRRLSRAEIRRIRTLVRMIARRASAANRRRERLLRRILSILARESRN